ncbi:nucleotidyltransferase domain-containing protein [Adhaeribacter soli]|uniref:Nucleotidyltransferase domain-containing protein n=1 Tax=Adhaeribacter soli TaxID=2607655 RepID=A0A5N1IRI2_9BACT|nr:nucleotidyltransferase domain-containing protein [Adhaeribacter soli]KAA9332775.1 nucleotidyltransferase domain-containing protein [Adhaeribacter soli]
MEIYAFGSVVRGEIDEFSDVDLLILKEKGEIVKNIDKEQFSIYSYNRITELWNEGNPFSWHLFVESKCIFSTNETPFLQSIGKPNKYNNVKHDLDKFYNLFKTSRTSMLEENYSIDFDLSMIFLSIRNFASCFALGHLNKFVFSRDSALNIGSYSIEIKDQVYNQLKHSRLLATRGIGKQIPKDELKIIINELPKIEQWFWKLLNLSK